MVKGKKLIINREKLKDKKIRDIRTLFETGEGNEERKKEA